MEGANMRSEKGFTFLELMVVMFILSLLVGIVGPRLIGRSDEARVVEARLQIKNFETALDLYKLDNGSYPETEQGLASLIEKPTIGKISDGYRSEGYLDKKRIPRDPWGNAYIYICPGSHGDYDIISYGLDGKAGGDKKNADITSWGIQDDLNEN
jgi:general secretion pathway protein G